MPPTAHSRGCGSSATTRSRSRITRYGAGMRPPLRCLRSSSTGSTPRSRSVRGSAAASTGSRTSPTCRGCCGPAIECTLRSTHILPSTSGSRGCSSAPPSPRRHMSSQVSELPSGVDAAWLAAHLGDEDLVVGDVRGPNAHSRGHIPGSRPLVRGSPPPPAEEASLRELAEEIVLRLRRHGITGRERLVLVDRGDGVGAMPAAQLAGVGGHGPGAIRLGGRAEWRGAVEAGFYELVRVREAGLEPNLRAHPPRTELD